MRFFAVRTSKWHSETGVLNAHVCSCNLECLACSNQMIRGLIMERMITCETVVTE